MRITKWLIILALLVFAGCSSGDGDSESEHIILRTLVGDVSETLTLVGGTAVTFPAQTWDEETIVIVADIFTAEDANPVYYPTLLNQGEDLMGATVVNTPVDELIMNDLPVRFQLLDFSTVLTSSVPGVGPGDQFAVYRFDPDNLIWNRWGTTFATVEANGDYATTVLPTDGMRGFVGSVALFKPNDLGSLPAVTKTVLEGKVVDGNGTGVATDVSVYVLVGANKFPRELDDPDAFVPNIPDPLQPSLNILVANAVMSESDGTFSVDLPESIIGQLINVSFGLADASYVGTDEFDIQTPEIINQVPITDAELTSVDSVRVVYGVNSVRSRPVN